MLNFLKKLTGKGDKAASHGHNHDHDHNHQHGGGCCGGMKKEQTEQKPQGGCCGGHGHHGHDHSHKAH